MEEDSGGIPTIIVWRADMRQYFNRTWQRDISCRPSLGQIGERRVIQIRPAWSEARRPALAGVGVHQVDMMGVMVESDGERWRVVESGEKSTSLF